MEIGNATKTATFKSFLYQSYKKHAIPFFFFVTPLFKILTRQTLTDDFWGLRNMNCAFPFNSKNLLTSYEQLIIHNTFNKNLRTCDL